MAPVKPKGSGGARKARKSATAGPSRVSKSKAAIKRPPPKQVKTKPMSSTGVKSAKKKQPQYTDAQLKLPVLNSIIPASATAAQRSGKGTGKKRNKVYIDDTESMMTILAMVNAEKEGQIKSKVMRERQMAEIREAREREAQKRKEIKKGKLEEKKEEIKKARRPKNESTQEKKAVPAEDSATGKLSGTKKRKTVSFAS